MIVSRRAPFLRRLRTWWAIATTVAQRTRNISSFVISTEVVGGFGGKAQDAEPKEEKKSETQPFHVGVECFLWIFFP